MGMYACSVVICSKTMSMRHLSSISTLLLASFLLNSCAFFNKINDKVFPYKATTVEEITQSPAVKPKAPVKAPNEEVVKPKPTAAATKQTTPPVQKHPTSLLYRLCANSVLPGLPLWPTSTGPASQGSRLKSKRQRPWAS